MGTTVPLQEMVLKLLDRQMQEQEWTTLIDSWKVVIGEDPLDDSPTIGVWVILKRSQGFEQRDEIRQHVLKAIAKEEKHWVYVHFRTKMEQAVSLNSVLFPILSPR